jgi:hypothetical protein
VSFAGNVDALSGVDVTGLLGVAGAVTQTGSGNQVSFAGNVDATNGVDVTGTLSVNGAVTQTGAGNQVSFAGNVDASNGIDVTGGDLNVTNNVVISGDLTVLGTETIVNTDQLYVKDPIVVINDSGSEVSSDWTGLSGRDGDGYNRIGWLWTGAGVGSLDGYWAVSIEASVGADADPVRALAYLGAGDGYGDLSSTLSGNSGASKIGVTPAGNISSNDVQAALEELDAEIVAATGGTDSINFIINQNATAGADENPCLIERGGDGTSLIEGYLCLITDAVAGDRWQFQIYEGGVRQTTDLHLGPSGLTEDVDAILTFNAGTGAVTDTASIKLDGTLDKLVYTATAHEFAGDTTMDNDLTVTGDLTANGNTIIGSSSADQVSFNATIITNLVPLDDAYYVGLTTNRWIDGYFSFFTPTNYSPVGDNDSLEGHLKGIDAALANVLVAPPRGVYVVTVGEGSSDTVDSTRAVNQGVAISTALPLTDVQFRDYIYIYRNGQLLYNDSATRAATGNVVNDVARQTANEKLLLFSSNLRKGDVIQIVDMR